MRGWGSHAITSHKTGGARLDHSIPWDRAGYESTHSVPPKVGTVEEGDLPGERERR